MVTRPKTYPCRYVMPLKDTERKSDGQPAIAASLEEFRKNFGIFTENAFQSFGRISATHQVINIDELC